MIFPGNFLSGIVYFPVISPPAVYISLLFSLTTAAVVSSYYTRNVLLSAQMDERASVVLICIITSRYNEVK